MRWYVSIGAVLVAGAMAGGDVAGIAAPSPHISSRRTASKPSVDVELVLATDISYSMDMDELAIQREGYAQAIVSKEFLQALKALPNSKIAITYFEWAASERPEDHHSLAADRRPGNRRRCRQRDHEDAGAPRFAHLDLGRDLFRDAAVRRRIPITASAA